MEPILWSETRVDRRELSACTICEASEAVECRDRFCHTGRRWAIGITWPGARLGGSGAVIDGRCRATVEDRRDPVGHLCYRGACVGCGWAGPSRDNSNAALEDALDHTLPEWRRVPVVERDQYDATANQLERWADQVTALYASHGLAECYSPASGGLIRTMRQPMGTRSHHSRGYYDVCAGVTPDTGPTPATEQLELF